MQHNLTWSIAQDTESIHVTMVGTINEESAFEQLVEQLDTRAQVRIDLSAICRITSSGIREWMHFIGPLSESRTVMLERCSPAIVSQLNIFRDFTGAATVRSYQVPYLCPSCDELATLDMDVAAKEDAPEEIPCPSCQAIMEFDDLRECYFSFLRWHHVVSTEP